MKKKKTLRKKTLERNKKSKQENLHLLRIRIRNTENEETLTFPVLGVGAFCLIGFVLTN